MNARAASRHAGSLPPMALLNAALPLWQRAMWLVFYALFAGLGVVVAAFSDDVRKGLYGTIVLLALGNGVLWGCWFSRALRISHEGDRARIPGMRRASAAALAGAFAVTVLLPTALVAAHGGDVLAAFGALSAAATIGLLFAVAAWWQFMLLFFAPWVLAPELSGLAKRAGIEIDLAFVLQQGTWIAAFAALQAWWLWRRIVARGDDTVSLPEWRRPILLGAQGVGWDWRGDASLADANATAWRARTPPWIAPPGYVRDVGPATPLRAMGAWLGGVFATPSPRQVAAQLGGTAALIALLLWMSPDGIVGALRDAFLYGGAAGVLGAPWLIARRLDVLRQHRAGEYAELALLPGWGDAATARRFVHHRVRRTLAWSLLAALLILIALLPTTGADTSRYACAAAMLCAITTGGAMLCLRPLAGATIADFATFMMLLPAILLLAATVVVMMPAHVADPALPWLCALWLALAAAYAGYAVVLHRRAWARPHPFLQP